VPKRSAGLLLHRPTPDGPEVLLLHPGGPYWAAKDDGAWTVPKGEYLPGEDPAVVAEREFLEELGVAAPAGPRRDLGELRQAGGKLTRLWALSGDLDVSRCTSNTFEIEWPARSGLRRSFPEVDRAAWFSVEEARRKLVPSLVPFLDRLLAGGDAAGDIG
jgi:predicted NUDIX family NTP pyrophosphohydrolase